MAKKSKTDASESKVIGATADGHSSIKFELSNGDTMFAIVGGGNSFEENARNRDVLVTVLQRMVKTADAVEMHRARRDDVVPSPT